MQQAQYADHVCQSFCWTALHSSCSAQAISKFTMPAMSPTMTEGGLASWKVKEGDKFAAGDVLLEIVSAPVWVLCDQCSYNVRCAGD